MTRLISLSPERRLAVRLMRAGLATAGEIAGAMGVRTQAVHYWAKAGGINYTLARQRRVELTLRLFSDSPWSRPGEDADIPNFTDLSKEESS